MSFWTKLKIWAEKKEREQWMAKYRNDQMCPHCKTWQGNCRGWAAWRDDGNSPDAHHAEAVCGKCNKKSYWFMGAMMPTGVGKKNNPGNLPDEYLPDA